MGQLKRYMPKAHVIKLNNPSTSGVPDIVVQFGRATWLEVKLLKKGASFDKCSPTIQQVTMRQLKHAGARAWYIIYDARQRQKSTWVYDATVFRDRTEDPEKHLVAGFPGFAHYQVAALVERLHQNDAMDTRWLEEL